MPDPVTISIPETHDRAELPGLLRVIASQIEDDYREGYHPRWIVTPADNGGGRSTATYRFWLVASPLAAPDGWAFCDDSDITQRVTIEAATEAAARDAAFLMAPPGYRITGVTLVRDDTDNPTT